MRLKACHKYTLLFYLNFRSEIKSNNKTRYSPVCQGAAKFSSNNQQPEATNDCFCCLFVDTEDIADTVEAEASAGEDWVENTIAADSRDVLILLVLSSQLSLLTPSIVVWLAL